MIQVKRGRLPSMAIFSYIKICLQSLRKIKNETQRKSVKELVDSYETQEDFVYKEFERWTGLLVKFSSQLVTYDQYALLNIIIYLPPNLIYFFLKEAQGDCDKIRLELLLYLKSSGNKEIIKDKVLFFALLCRYRSSEARAYVDSLMGKDYKRCLAIAISENCLEAVAYINYRQGLYKDSFNLYIKL